MTDSSNTDVTLEHLGLSSISSSTMSAEHAVRLAATLDLDEQLDDGSDLPLLWHWIYFTPAVSSRSIGSDGHPRLSDNGPTSGLPRRMWAGGRVRRLGRVVLGEPATRRSLIVAADRKSGRSGQLLVITIAHEIEQAGHVVLTEEQDLIYRSAGERIPAPSGQFVPDAPTSGWTQQTVMDPVRLFRFSALTFNSHRIHFDRDYAVSEEGYPEIVVHGPLTALLLSASSRTRLGHDRSFEFRASAPLFAGSPFTLMGEPDEGGAVLSAIRNDGTVAMLARST